MIDRRPTRSAVARYGLTVGAWLFLIVVQYLYMHLATNLWVLALGVWGGAWTAAIAFTIWSAIKLRRHPPAALAILALAVVLGGLVATIDWRGAFARTWLPMHRAAFIEAARLGDSGELAFGADMYGDAPLPPALTGIAVDGQMWIVGECGGRPVLFVPAWLGIPDGGFGYIHVHCPNPPTGRDVTSEADYFDGNGDRLIARFPVGDGWWWADGGYP